MMDMPVIDTYTRAEAIADRVLHDVTEKAGRAGFAYPMAIASHAWVAVVAAEGEHASFAEAQNLADLLVRTKAVMLANRHTDDPMIRFEHKGETLYVHVGPGDEFEPVLTVMARYDL